MYDNEIWERIIRHVRRSFHYDQNYAWLDDIDYIGRNNLQWIIQAPNRARADWIRDYYLAFIQQEVNKMLGNHIKVVVTSK